MDDIVGYTCYGLPAVFNPQWAKNMKTLQEYLYFPNYFWRGRGVNWNQNIDNMNIIKHLTIVHFHKLFLTFGPQCDYTANVSKSQLDELNKSIV